MAEYKRQQKPIRNRPYARLHGACIHGMSAVLGIAVFLTGLLAYTSFAIGAQPPPPQTAPPPILEPTPSAPGTSSSTKAPQPTPDGPIPLLTPARISHSHFQFTIDPKTPWHELLPNAPSVKKSSLIVLPQTLAEVPEVNFQEPLSKSLNTDETLKQTSIVFAKVHHLNQDKTDGFMEKLLSKRPDLVGLPMAMGDSCRMKERQRPEFASVLLNLRNALASTQDVSPVLADQMVDHFRRTCEGAEIGSEALHEAMVAVLMQVVGVEAEDLRVSMVKSLTRIPHRDATRALAQLAIFSEEETVRNASVRALQVRREKDYTDILVKGLTYPWPKVARRSVEAIVMLKRSDLIPDLLQVMDKPDPRSAQVCDGTGKKKQVVRELVRINHHRNCLLCHAPADSAKSVVRPMLLAQMPIPNQELPKPSAKSGAYENTIPDILVRIDVTYLRQDFSVKMPVADAAPWPDMQRFDFVVRTREVSDQEAETLKELLRPREAGVLSPYHRAALFALRELTGRDTEPTAQAWRKLLGM